MGRKKQPGFYDVSIKQSLISCRIWFGVKHTNGKMEKVDRKVQLLSLFISFDLNKI